MTWQVSPVLFHLGPLQIRWYGLLFASGFLIGYALLQKFYEWEKEDPAELEKLFIYMMIGTVLGARLGHCLFYDPLYYLQNPLEILKVWHGGLASHGGVIGTLTAVYLFGRRVSHKSWLWVADRVSIAAILTGALIRIGNFFNSEIIGKPTDLPWAVQFLRVDVMPRHPSQVYESICYFLIFILLFSVYKRQKEKTPEGLILGLFFTLVFSVRFLIEWTKENQSDFENNMPINMGQLLSLPLIAFGLWLIWRSQSAHKVK